jgi:transposase
MREHKRWAEQEIEKLLTMSKQGVPYRQLAQTFHVSLGVIGRKMLKLAKEGKLTLRGKGWRKPSTTRLRNAVVEDWNTGKFSLENLRAKYSLSGRGVASRLLYEARKLGQNVLSKYSK